MRIDATKAHAHFANRPSAPVALIGDMAFCDLFIDKYSNHYRKQGLIIKRIAVEKASDWQLALDSKSALALFDAGIALIAYGKAKPPAPLLQPLLQFDNWLWHYTVSKKPNRFEMPTIDGFLYENTRQSVLHNEARTHNLQFNQEAWMHFLTYTSENMAGALAVLKRLIYDGATKIDTNILNDALCDGARYPVFALSDAIIAQDSKRALLVLDAHDTHALVPIVEKDITRLASLAVGLPANSLGIFARQLGAYKALSMRHRPIDYQNFYLQLFRIDCAQKGQIQGLGQDDAKQMLRTLVMGIIACP